MQKKVVEKVIMGHPVSQQLENSLESDVKIK